MTQQSKWPVFLPLVTILAFIALAIVLADQRGLQPPAAGDLRHFHPRADAAEPDADLGYASMQVKNVAASRHVPVQEVRHLMEEFTIGHQRVDVRRLNAALDERWPMK